MRVPQTLFVLIQAAGLVKCVSWTFHRSCYQNEALKNGMIKAVEDAVGQADQAVKKLREASYLPPIPGGPQPPEAARRIREVADFLTAPFFNNKAEDMITLYERVSKLDPKPVGENENFADGPTWISQESSNENYLNFVIACAPDLTETTDRFWNTEYRDNIRKRKIEQQEDSSLILIQNDIKKGDYDHPTQFVKATTQGDRAPTGGRRTVPEAIVFHKLWLDGLLAKEGNILADQKTLDYVTRQDSAQKHRLKGRTAMDTLLWRAEGVMLHEFFHLTAFGGLGDIPPNSREAYGWTNNVRAKNTGNPELYALLGLAIKLTVNGYRVDEEGMVSRW